VIRKLLGVSALVGCLWLAIMGVTRCTAFGQVDACLDDGGRWDQERSTCIGARSAP
jgi:hypothetical protein